MKQKRGLFEAVFGKLKNKIEQVSEYRLLNSWDTTFTPFSGNMWDVSTVRAAVNAFARNAAKLTPKHIRRDDGSFSFGFSTQTQFGFIPSATSEWSLIEMSSVFWNETNTVTVPLLFSFDKGTDTELLFITSGAIGATPAHPQGTILNPSGTPDDFYVVCVFLGKMACVKITK
jgi:hypothetical protein